MVKKIFSVIMIILIIGTIFIYKSPKLLNFNHKQPSTNVVSSSTTTNLDVEACNLSGNREPNKIVDVGYKERKYYAYTNSTSQLVKVTAKKLELQNKGETLYSGRYCKDEAKVKGTEKTNLDEGHVIADSLGGVSNAYNITPQNSFLNRKGKQYQMEEEQRKALVTNHNVHDFIASITYPNSSDTIPNHYHIEVFIDNDKRIYDFDNK